MKALLYRYHNAEVQYFAYTVQFNVDEQKFFVSLRRGRDATKAASLGRIQNARFHAHSALGWYLKCS